MAPPKNDVDRELQVLDAEMRKLEAEYNMFFAGRLPRLPWETRTRVEALVKKHDRSFIRNTADRFRFESMQNKYAKFCELWERQLSQMEGGRPKRGGGARPPATPRRTAEKATPVENPDRVKELYEKLAEVKQAAGEATVPRDQVAALVKAPVAKPAAEGSEVALRVALTDGNVSLTVKPVRAGED